MKFSDIFNKFRGLLLSIQLAFKKIFRCIKGLIDILFCDFIYDVFRVRKSVEDSIKEYQRLGFIEETDTDKINQLSHHLGTYTTYQLKVSLIPSLLILIPIVFLSSRSDELSRLLVFFLVKKGLNQPLLHSDELGNFNLYYLAENYLSPLLLLLALLFPILLLTQFPWMNLTHRDTKSQIEHRSDYKKVIRLMRSFIFFLIFWSIGMLALVIKIALTPVELINSDSVFSFTVDSLIHKASFPVQLLLTFPLIIIFSSIILFGSISASKILIPDSYITFKIVSLLSKLKTENNFCESRFRSSLIDDINAIADCFQYSIPRLIRTSSAYDRAALEKEYRNIANGFRSLRSWLYSPKADTKEHLIRRLRENLHSFLDGAIDDLPRVEEFLGANVTRKEVFVSTTNRVINLAIRVAMPFLLLWVLGKINSGLAANIRDYLFAGAFSLSSLIILIELDPNIGQKLDILKQLQALFPGRK
jgi:hypothetical protein